MLAAFSLGSRSLLSRAGRPVAFFGVIVGFLVTAILLVSLALPTALGAQAHRRSDRYPISPDAGITALRQNHGAPIDTNQRDTIYRHLHVTIIEATPNDEAAPPPGLAHLPAPGTSAVSPDLRKLLRSDPDAVLSAEIPDVQAVIGEAGLVSPRELIAYVGVTTTPRDGTYASVEGWGSRGPSLFRNDVSPAVGLPIAALVILPLLGLIACLLRLDATSRRQRVAVLNLLGATSTQRFAADVGVVLVPVAIGALAAAAAQGLVATFTADVLFARRVMFPSDLHLSAGPASAASVVLLLVLLAACARESLRAGALSEVRGRIEIKLARRVITASALLIAGAALTTVILTAGRGSASLQSYGPLFLSVGLLTSGLLVALHPVVAIVSRLRLGNDVAADLSAARAMDRGASWRTPAVVLTLVGLIAGTAMAVLTVLDAATQTQQLLWDPSRVTPTATFLSLPASSVKTVLPAESYPSTTFVVPAGDVELQDGQGHNITRPGVLVDCARLGDLVALPEQTPSGCGSAWVIDDGLNPRTSHSAVSSPTSGRVLYTSIGTAGYRVPAAVFNGTESVLLPVDHDTLASALAKLSTTPVFAETPTSSDEQVEQLRGALWRAPAPLFNGSQGPLSVVVSRSDLLQDEQHFKDTYTALVIGLVVMGSLCALFTVALSNVIDEREAHVRRQVLRALGGNSRLLRSIRIRETAIPGVVAVAAGGVGGVVVGSAYLHLADYPQLDGILAHFPVWTMLAVVAGELSVLLLLVAASAFGHARSASGALQSAD